MTLMNVCVCARASMTHCVLEMGERQQSTSLLPWMGRKLLCVQAWRCVGVCSGVGGVEGGQRPGEAVEVGEVLRIHLSGGQTALSQIRPV